jgi:hypothetical protein
MSDLASPARPAAGPGSAQVRIVVHGPPYAGKTTTARALGERLGQPVHTPEEDEDGRTVLFDWMEYVGGRFEGQPICTHLVTVPGHDAARSAHLVASADVVLFVADTTAAGIDASAALLRTVRGQLDEPGATAGLLVQANKRDAPSALPLEEVVRRLDLRPTDEVIETVATDGDGIRQAFVFAVREGLKHLLEPRLSLRSADPSALADELRALDAPAQDEAEPSPFARHEPPRATEPPEATGPPEPPVAVEADAPAEPAAIVEPAARPGSGEPVPTRPRPPVPVAERDVAASPIGAHQLLARRPTLRRWMLGAPRPTDERR